MIPRKAEPRPPLEIDPRELDNGAMSRGDIIDLVKNREVLFLGPVSTGLFLLVTRWASDVRIDTRKIVDILRPTPLSPNMSESIKILDRMAEDVQAITGISSDVLCRSATHYPPVGIHAGGRPDPRARTQVARRVAASATDPVVRARRKPE